MACKLISINSRDFQIGVVFHISDLFSFGIQSSTSEFVQERRWLGGISGFSRIKITGVIIIEMVGIIGLRNVETAASFADTKEIHIEGVIVVFRDIIQDFLKMGEFGVSFADEGG